MNPNLSVCRLQGGVLVGLLPGRPLGPLPCHQGLPPALPLPRLGRHPLLPLPPLESASATFHFRATFPDLFASG